MDNRQMKTMEREGEASPSLRTAERLRLGRGGVNGMLVTSNSEIIVYLRQIQAVCQIPHRTSPATSGEAAGPVIPFRNKLVSAAGALPELISRPWLEVDLLIHV
jgi:hypothetical protein